MTPTQNSSRRLAFASLVLSAAFGCSRDVPEESAGISLVPVGGVITLECKPLANSVVTFLPKDGASYVGETDAEGRYELEGANSVGVPPGHYKVTLSANGGEGASGQPEQQVDVEAGRTSRVVFQAQ